MRAICFIVGLLLSGLSVSATEVRIYFVPWEVDSNRSMSRQDVRGFPWIKTEIIFHDYAREFVSRLEEVPMSKAAYEEEADVRLVVDVVEKDEVVETYYAGYFRLYSERRQMAGDIDEAFRKRFSALWQAQKTKQRPADDRNAERKDGEPGATDNPGDAQRLREDH